MACSLKYPAPDAQRLRLPGRGLSCAAGVAVLLGPSRLGGAVGATSKGLWGGGGDQGLGRGLVGVGHRQQVVEIDRFPLEGERVGGFGLLPDQADAEGRAIGLAPFFNCVYAHLKRRSLAAS